MVKNIDNIPKNKRPFMTPLIRGIINKKQQFGLSVNPNEILSKELQKPKRVNFERRRVISNHIDHIWGIDLITMIKYSKQNNNYKYILTVIDFLVNIVFVEIYRDIKCSICERYNQTILNRIYKNFTLNNITIWIKDLNKLVKEYNNSYHRTIKMKPIDASKKSNKNIVRKNYNFEITVKNPKFKIGDRVGISLLKNTFEKGHTSN